MDVMANIQAETGARDENIEAVAVIGMAGRFPGAETVEQFWSNLQAGVESVAALTDADLTHAGVPKHISSRPDYVRAKGVLKQADCFDHAFFGYSPREAELMDPQHRLLLETSHSALESAGYGDKRGSGWTGVFAGAARASYWLGHLAGNPAAGEGDDQIFIGNEKDFLATRVAFKLDLHGPAVDVQTGCSTSLVAVHMACRSLLSFECDMALAGGVTVSLPLSGGYRHQEGSVLAGDGHCRPFDNGGDGIVPGNASAMVVLKRLSDALGDGDIIHAFIRGSAINNDGARKMSFTAPSVEGQMQAILLAQQLAGLSGDDIGLIEAHGTGTRLGDPIEVAALTQAFRETSVGRRFCALGSLKGNIGHLDAAAGVAGLIKAVCAVRDGVIPPTINVARPNETIDFASSPFYLPMQAEAWNAPVRRAGVSAFGIGGTNAHVIVESPPEPVRRQSQVALRILPFSACTEPALDRQAAALAEALAEDRSDDPAGRLGDIAFTLQTGRAALRHRCAMIADNAGEAAAVMQDRVHGRLLQAEAPVNRLDVAMLFPGGGVHYPGMAKGLLVSEPAFRDAFAEMAGHFQANGINILPLVDAMPDGPGTDQATITLPAIFAVSYALARLWQARGVKPRVLLGHSLGEYVAATIAGIFEPADAARIVAVRSRLQQESAPGAMVSVMAPADVVMELAGPGVDVAAINGPGLCTVSAPLDVIEVLERQLDRAGLRWLRLPISVGGHSRAVVAMAEGFRQAFDGIPMRAPSIPVISSLTGLTVTNELTSPDYWVKHLCGTVRFDLALQTLLSMPDLMLLECGPGDVCTALAVQHPQFGVDHHRVTSVRKAAVEGDDHALLLEAAARLWINGIDVDLGNQAGIADGRRCSLPTYPFERVRLWVDAPAPGRRGSVADAEKPIDDWFYLPSWRRVTAPVAEAVGSGAAVVFDDGSDLAREVIGQIEAAGWGPVITLRPGTRFSIDSEVAFRIRPGLAEDMSMALTAADISPSLVMHLWSCGDESDELTLGFHTLIAMMQGVAAAGAEMPARIVAAVSSAHMVTPGERVIPQRAALLGAMQVIAQEFPATDCRVVDFSLDRPPAEIASSLLRETTAVQREPVVALRGSTRWARHFETMPITADGGDVRSIAPDSTIVITGGFGRVGLLAARHLAELFRVHIALVIRPGFPPEDRWDVVELSGDPLSKQRIHAVKTMREAGLKISVHAADVADAGQMRDLFSTLSTNGGGIAGVIHAAAVTTGNSLISPVLELDMQAAKVQFRPKVEGLIGLEAAIQACATPPSFVLLMSSNASVLGGIGFAAYSAANHVLDHFAADRDRSGATAWISANWDRWLISNDELAAGNATSMDRFAMLPAESLDALVRIILRCQTERVVITRGDLEARLQIWIHGDKPAEDASANRQPRIGRAQFKPAETATQQALCGLWGELLGIAEIGIDDNFFELGGHSLRAIQLLARIAEMFGVRLSLKTFFAVPTVAGLAAEIATMLEPGSGQDRIVSLLDGLDTLAAGPLTARAAL